MARFIVNNNGTPVEDLVEYQRQIGKSIQTLRDALHKAMPHGRDYQVNENSNEDLLADRNEVLGWLEVLDKMESWSYNTAVRAQDQS